ncbi:HNH endonuclease [Mycoplasmopsis cynos]|uniref:MAG4270 family putative restriction endonuclease n=1 Tax=Mycoplasmopsis cynos TaxID=171284 RepID=UPI002AFDD334|nr:HNH endonuclease [Mycoplasmopsis cynos]WQQ15877.1 HNH endonuclease [Mycoplasmopsis cynos]
MIINSDKLTKFSFKIFSKENSKQKVNADLECYFDQDGILVKYKIKLLQNTMFDLYATPSWFDKNNKNFKIRESLIKLLFWDGKKTQEKRPSFSSKLLHTFTDDELIKVNYYLNNNYDGTLKNIVAILKGNNPSGSYQNPNSSELKSNCSYFKNNLIMLLDLLKIPNDRIDDEQLQNAVEANIEDFYNFLANSSFWKIIYEFVYELESWKPSQNSASEQKKLQKLKKKVEQHKIKYIELINEAENDVEKLRKVVSKFRNEIKYFSINTKTQTEIAHIYPVSKIKQEIREEIINLIKSNNIINFNKLKNTTKYKNIINQIIDVNNLFILEPTIHTEFDNKKFYWDPDSGSVIYLNKNSMEDEIINKLQNYKIDITSEFEMRKYLKKYKELHLHLDK